MPDWLTSDGLFSVQSGWSMLSTRVRPWLYNDPEGYKRIRRLLLDLARGPSEISKGLQDKHRFGSAQNSCNNCMLCTDCKNNLENLNDEFDSNRLDPYQVGITILSAYTNYPLGIFSQFNENWKFVSFSDCIQACIFESRLFSNKADSENKFMDMILQFLVFIRDNEESYEDHKLLANKILSFCSAARISPRPIDDVARLDRILRNYYGTKGRLFQISLKDIHKASNFLKLDQNLKWGWSIVVTVCFEKSVDKAYSETEKVFGGNAWLMSRTPGRALFFEQSGLVDLDLEKKFCKVFYDIFLETLLNACDGADSEDELRNEISFALNKGDKDGSIRNLIDKLIHVSCSGVSCPISTLHQQDHKNSNSKSGSWSNPLDNVPVWAKSLEYTAARGVRRFRLIQSLWQDLLSLRGNEISQSVRPQKSNEEQKTFVYLDCIQLGDLLWNEENSWLRSFEKARIIAPIIEGILAAFVSLSDTLYPEFKFDDMKFGPQALGGDELHIIVPGEEEQVRNDLEVLGQKLWKHLEKYGLVKFDNWSKPNNKSGGRLYFKGGQQSQTKLLCPKTMWWFGLISECEKHDFDKSVESFLDKITTIKDFKRKRWVKSDNLFQNM